ncbi:MAG: hypothetical protein H6625_02880 [Bdellovibrionaceae bacterium]|nr:hypothetical protein [Pseudobdellovibrionaceae bacterium]
MLLRNTAKLSQHFKVLVFLLIGLASILIFTIVILDLPDKEEKSSASLNYEFLGRVDAIHQVQADSTLSKQTQPLIEFLNLNPGANLSVEKMQLCEFKDDPSSLLNVEQTLRIIWEAKKSGKLVRISYSSLFNKCIESVKMVESPKY